MRHSLLSQINRENVAQLKVAWVLHTGDISEGRDRRKRSAFETTPLLVDGKLFLTTPFKATLDARLIALDRSLSGICCESGSAPASPLLASVASYSAGGVERVKADCFAPKVLKLVGDGQSYREISHRLELSKNTALDIVKRDRAT